MRINIKSVSRKIIVVALFMLYVASAYCQTIENDYQSRASIELSKKIIKGLKFTFTPELRMNESFDIAKYQFENELSYKVLDFMTLSANYRFIGDVKTEKATEYFHKYQFSSVFKTKYKRFKPGFRIAYSNYADDEVDQDDQFLKYKGFVSYNIPKCKITPKASVELFHQLSENSLYKYRYSLMLDYKINGKLSVEAGYKLDSYITKDKNRHIFGFGLNYSF